jgi:glycogen debranching enzyme
MSTTNREAAAAAPIAGAKRGAAPVAQFFIPAAASLQERRPRTLKHDDTFAVFDHNGDVLSGEGSPEGIFYRDTRHLSHLYLTIGGARPMLLSSTLRDDNATLTCDLSNPDIFDGAGQLQIAHDLIHLRRACFIWQTRCFERLIVRNFDVKRQHIVLRLDFAADFADIFEVRGTQRARTGVHEAPAVAHDSVTLGYTGLDDVCRSTRLQFEPAPSEIAGDHVVFELDLEPRAAAALYFRILADRTLTERRAPRRGFFSALRESRRTQRATVRHSTSIATSNEIFNESIRRSRSDLQVLITETPQGPYPYAGIPWFSTVFGRDALITALETLWIDPSIARGVLGYLAHSQATVSDAVNDAEPGKILHEARQGEMAELREVPFKRYYGSVDSTPLFLMLAGAYLERTGDLIFLQTLLPNLEAALGWIDVYGDRDGDGFVEYGRRSGEGLINQGWKDSHDSVFHADGTLARGPIALAEVQGYVYAALRGFALVRRQLGAAEQAKALDDRAEQLRKRFDDSFFDEHLGTYVLALDGDKQPCRVRSSNAGHALYTGIAYPERAGSVVDTLMASPSFCGWGVRTIPSTEARYNPMSYHNGSVWPHDNAMIAAGFARYGFSAATARIFEGLFAASTYIDLRRLPELFCGFAQQRAQGPTFYPVACIPQAWSAAAPLSLLRSCLGLAFDPAARRISFNEPFLPGFLDEVTLCRLRVGGASADVALRRSHSQVVVDVIERNGDVRVITTS